MLYDLGLISCYFGVVNIQAWILGFWDDLRDIRVRLVESLANLVHLVVSLNLFQ